MRPYNLYKPATLHTNGVDVTVAPGLDVGYVMGTGDDVPAALADLGIHVHFLGAQDIATGDLSPDFQGWVEERGHSFMTSWAPEYTPLVEMHDPDQAPQEGGLLFAQCGKGVYVYAGLAFYRQFTEGVPGAYRIFANLSAWARRPRSRATRASAAGVA